MSFEPFMWSTFCDDVRQEVGNKLSFLGIYGPNLIVPTFPTTLVKLCCILSVRAPASSPPKTVHFKLYRDEEILFENDVSPAMDKESSVGTPADDGEARVITISTIAQLISLQITRRCYLRTLAIVDGKELRGGALEMLAAEVK